LLSCPQILFGRPEDFAWSELQNKRHLQSVLDV
jgi:hypothetical protein